MARQITETVQWHKCVRFAKSRGVSEWIVVGPSKVLGNLILKEFPKDSVISISSAADIRNFS